MKMKLAKKILLYVLIIIFILSMLIWSFPIFAQTTNDNQFVSDSATPTPAISLSVADLELIKSESIVASDFDLSESKILPGSLFYFLKDWKWSVKKFFTFSQIGKAKIELKQLGQKVLELKIVLDSDSDDQKIKKAISQYEKSLRIFQARLLRIDKSDSKIGPFLDLAVENILNQEKALNEINYQLKFDEIKTKLDDLINGNFVTLNSLAGKFGSSSDLSIKVFEKIFTIGSGKIFGNFTTAEILDKLFNYFQNTSTDAELIKDKFLLQVQADLHNAEQLLQNKLPYILRGIFGQKISEQKILRDLEERSGQREFFENLRTAISEEIISTTEYNECKSEIDSIEKEFNEFKDSAQDEKLSNNVSTFLIQVEAHLKQAKITTSDQAKTICGLVNSASVLLNNAQKIMAQEKEGFDSKILKAVNDLTDINEKLKNHSKEEYFRIFNLANQAQMQIEAMKSAQKKNKTELFLKEINKFDLILANLNNLIDFIGNKENNKIISSLIVNKELLSKSKIDEFSNWCQKQGGITSENFGILPICLISEKISIMLGWYENFE